MRYGNSMGYVNSMRYVNNMSYVNNMGYVSDISIFVNRLKSLDFCFLKKMDFFVKIQG